MASQRAKQKLFSLQMIMNGLQEKDNNYGMSRKCIFFLLVVSSFFFISCKRGDNLFTILPSSRTNLHFSNNLEKKEGFGILYYLYYYNGGGVATGDINNDGLADIFFYCQQQRQQ